MKKEPAAVEKTVVEAKRISGTLRTSGSKQSEQLIILVAALGFGILGLAIHILWIVSIVLMALLVGLIGAEARSHRGRGIVSEVVSEARAVVDDVVNPPPATSPDTAEETSDDESGDAE